MGAAERTPCELYLLTPPVFRPEDYAILPAIFEAGKPKAVQLRLKNADDDAWAAAAEILRPLCARAGAAFLLNDRVDLCQALGADGVHVGAEDTPYAEARLRLGPSAVIGVSAYADLDRGLAAASEGADYVAFGAFFETRTKVPRAKASPALLAWWQENITVPVTAIGGITAENCAGLAAAGADFVAVIGGIWDHPQGPVAGTRAIREALSRAAESFTQGKGQA